MQQQAVFAANNTRLPPNATKASEGHASKAKAAYDPVEQNQWKMKKFSKATAKVRLFSVLRVI